MPEKVVVTIKSEHSTTQEFFVDLQSAITFAESNKSGKTWVIVRPNYNEKDDKGNFFREWRSWNGEKFVECRWDF